MANIPPPFSDMRKRSLVFVCSLLLSPKLLQGGVQVEMQCIFWCCGFIPVRHTHHPSVCVKTLCFWAALRSLEVKEMFFFVNEKGGGIIAL